MTTSFSTAHGAVLTNDDGGPVLSTFWFSHKIIF
jgi:hypothetical protein